jgi:hypothetical protein
MFDINSFYSNMLRRISDASSSFYEEIDCSVSHSWHTPFVVSRDGLTPVALRALFIAHPSHTMQYNSIQVLRHEFRNGGNVRNKSVQSGKNSLIMATEAIATVMGDY